MIAELFLCAALALPPVNFFKPPLTKADETFFRFVREVTDSNLKFVHKTATWDQMTKVIFEMPKGGVVFIDQEFDKLLNYFRGRDFERFPMMWRTYHIYRRRGAAA